jgi:HSP20 family protein
MAESKTSDKQRTGSRDTATEQAGGAQSGQARGEMSRQSQSQRGGSMQRRSSMPALLALNPFELMRRMTEDLMVGGRAAGGDDTLWSPRIEALQEGNEFVIRAELPGMDPDQIIVDISDDAVTIHGERREQRREQREGAIVSEIVYGEFNRVIPLPEGVIADSATAVFTNGILEVRMPAPPSEVSRGRRLDVSQSASGQGQGQTAGGSQAEGRTSGTGSGTSTGQSGTSGASGEQSQGGGRSR